LEHTALLNALSTSLLSTVKWRDIFAGLGRARNNPEADTALLLEKWLADWQSRTPIIPLLPITLTDETIANSRSIVIPVDVPSITVVHTADLRLAPTSSPTGETNIAITNEPISASLHIKWSRIWDTQSSSNLVRRPSQPLNGDQPSSPEILEFVYEVSGSSDTWIIGGRRRGHFRIPASSASQENNQLLKFPILLVPLREGYHQFPSLEIKPVPVAKTMGENEREASEGVSGHGGKGATVTVTSEVNYKNVGETIRVVSNAGKTTVSLDASGPGGGAWLLESERRRDVEASM